MCLGSRWDFSSLNTFSCCRYSSGIFPFSDGWGILGWIVTHPMKYLASGLVHGTFFVHDVNIAFCTFDAHKMIGSWV
jgi:hypothetical protein